MKEGWEYKKLGEVTTAINGLWTGKKPPFINVAVVRNTNFTKDCKLDMTNIAYLDVEQKQYTTRKLHPGDIIIEKSGGSDKQPVGRPVLFDIAEGEFSFSNFTSTLRINDLNVLFPKFLHYTLFDVYLRGDTFKMQSKTTGIHNLDFKAYNRLLIPIPPLSEQQRIVEELDLLSSIIEKKKAQLKELDSLAQSIFYDMFGDNNYEIVTLGEVVEIKSTLVSPTDLPYSEMLHVSPSNIISNVGSIVDCVKAKEESLISGKYTFSKGMILYSKIRPNLNKVAIPNFDGICSADMYPLSIKGKVNSIFIWRLLLSKGFLEYAIKHSGRARMPKLNREALFAYRFPLPPLPLQQQFAEKVEAIEHQKEMIKQSIKEVETLINSRMDYYFDG